MEDKRLDKIIEDRLGEFEMPYQSGSWDALAGKLNDVDATERFDESMRRKLSDIELSYQPLYWDLLAQRLEQENAFRKQLLRYKATELLLVLLILITFVQIFPNQTMKNILPFSKNGISSETSLTKQVEVDQSNDYSDLTLEETNYSEVSVASLIAEETNSNTIPSDPILGFVDSTPTNTDEIENASTLPDEAAAMTSLTDEEHVVNSENIERPTSIVAQTIVSQPIALLQNTAEITLLEENKVKKRWRIGILAASNADYIQTPYDEIFNKAPISRFDLGGYSGGVLVSKEWKRWEIETGLIYSHKKYKPTDPRLSYYGNITEGYNVEGLKDIELNTIQLPVNVSYDIVQKEKWNLYMIGGASINVAIVANYDVGKVSARALNVASSIVRNGEVLELSEKQQELFNEKSVPSEPESSALKRRKFSNGVFNGGSYKENSFYTANIGFGMERHFDERLSIFFQPTYRQHLTILNKGIGPNIDRISTLNLLIGAKIGF